ncbi:alcohol dehydrogenase catalytic domain-containing protein [Thermoplasmatales archaeon AK]|nr:alcohol dehydrogenase catalytic domain-containing protein [Thermoplasmatales archaeon AK]
MKAGVLKALNTEIVVEDVMEPEIREDEVLIKQNLTGICYRDILTQGGYFPRLKTPIIPGHEISGVVVKKGSHVKKFNIGDHVASLIYVPCGKCEYCLRGDENLCPNKNTFGETVNGAYAEFIAVPEISLVKVPEGVGDADASLSACVTGMVYHALTTVGQIKNNDWVMITGAGGGVGLNAIQVAKALGARVVAETSSPFKAELIAKQGADYIVTGDQFDREAKKITGDGPEIVLDTVGAPTFERALRSLRFGGKLVTIGNVSPNPVPLPLGLIIVKGNSVRGSISSTRKDMMSVLELARNGKLKAATHRTVTLEQVNEAYSEMKEKKSAGRIMIKVG